MSIFGKIMSTIFGSHAAAAPSAGAGTSAGTAMPSGSTPMSNVDVEAVLSKLAAETKEKLDWRKSIVDLMKLVGMDSSLAERKELAKELNYTGDTSDSAKMNVWLHKEVIRKISENGGKVPNELLS